MKERAGVKRGFGLRFVAGWLLPGMAAWPYAWLSLIGAGFVRAGWRVRDRAEPGRVAAPPGGRKEFIQWIQDVRDQRGILRNYVKYDNEIRTGKNVKQLVHRALQLVRSESAGLVYLVGARCTR